VESLGKQKAMESERPVRNWVGGRAKVYKQEAKGNERAKKGSLGKDVDCDPDELGKAVVRAGWN